MFLNFSVPSLYSQTRPNIIFIMADDFGWGDLGSYGQQNIQTPELDQIAAEGMKFTQFYAGAPLCSPTRGSIMTGKHTGHASIRQNKISKLREGEETLGTALKTGGYTTGFIGKWGVGWDLDANDPNIYGFDHFYGYVNQSHAHNYYPSFLYRNGQKEFLQNEVPNEGTGAEEGTGYATVRLEYAPDLFTEDALEFIDSYADDPFFLFLSYTNPHVNNEATTEKALEIPDLGIYEDKADWNHAMKAYAAMITKMDTDIGKIMDKLKALNIDENTIVFFTGDNGPHNKGGYSPEMHNSTGGLRDNKFSMYEGGIREPLIARWPNHIAAGSTTDHVSAFWDVMSTIADLGGGLNTPDDIDGISFLPVLLGEENQEEHEVLYWERHIPGSTIQQGIRFGKWKGVRSIAWSRRNDSNYWPEMELFDLDVDPYESEDLSGINEEVVIQLEEFMARESEPDPTGNLEDVPDFVTQVEEVLLVEDCYACSGQVLKSYPNPAQNTMSITIDLDHPGTVTLNILDMKGRLVTRLIEDQYLTGSLTLSLDGNKGRSVFSSGLYLCELMINDHQGKQRVIEKIIIQ